MNPNTPIQPNDIAEEVYRSWNYGASVVVINARNKQGNATSDPDVFREISHRIGKRDVTSSYSMVFSHDGVLDK